MGSIEHFICEDQHNSYKKRLTEDFTTKVKRNLKYIDAKSIDVMKLLKPCKRRRFLTSLSNLKKERKYRKETKK